MLIEAVEMYGIGNWAEVSEHVSTKSSEECLRHYLEVYYGTDKKPLPDMDAILGPEYAIEEPNDGGAPSSSSSRRLRSGHQSVGRANDAGAGAVGVAIGDARGAPGQADDAGVATGAAPAGAASAAREADAADTTAAGKAGPSSHGGQAPDSDGIRIEKRAHGKQKTPTKPPGGPTDGQQQQQLAQKQPSPLPSGSGVSFDITGYIVKREEFDVEHDADAEAPLADMEIVGDEDERTLELKEKMLLLYHRRQMERYRRRDFVTERGLLNVKEQQAIERRHSKEDLEVAGRLRVFSRYMSKEDHEQLVNGMMYEQHLRQRIEELKELRRNGVTTLVEAEVYERAKRRRDADREKVRALGAVQAAGASGTVKSSAAVRANRYLARDDPLAPIVASNSLSRELQKLRTNSANTTQIIASNMSQRSANRKPLGTMDVMELEGQPGYELLTSRERELCRSCKLLPLFYLAIKDTFIRESELQGHLSRTDIPRLVQADNSKLNRVYDFMIEVGAVKAQSDA